MLRTASLIIALAALSAPCFAQSQDLVPFELTYVVKAKGFTAGRSTLRLTRQTNTSKPALYEVISTAKPKGLGRLAASGEVVEQATFTITADGVRTQHAELKDTVADPAEHATLAFDLTAQQVTGSFQNQPLLHAIDEQGPFIDRASLQFAIANDLARNQLKAAYAFVDNDRIKTYQIEDHGFDSLKIKRQKYATRHLTLSREGSSRSLNVWYAIELHYAPIKIEQLRKGKRQTQAIMTSYETL